MRTCKIFSLAIWFIASHAFALPRGFVYLHQIAPDIEQDMRYAQDNNFTGHPVPGYKSGVCILTRKAAEKLKLVQNAAYQQGYQLKVYDCYRPETSVRAFYQWSQNKSDTRTKARFYPREKKYNLFRKGYIASYSGHSRGSTVDLTLVKIGKNQQPKHPLQRCYDKTARYLDDNSINMGTRHDCFDVSAHYHYTGLSNTQKKNRRRLRTLMTTYGFQPYSKEWWHFSLRNEPFPKTYFDFPVQ
ncbi:M15 family metallopeptidase [Legionella israelensis]|uniref:D-alanyl-D-alanine dipeptidase n=1 Tax=Legionella israelensis TaxID=454 RepID=A0A0W0W6W7_9GAMM|nr:M15 family metallopeptidase [Legionella israelensis]KTD28111.1 D-alanyl-D-alanine dipeptidase [Legionella israelensis]QBS08907.1 D-alanyl-D-alanine dipeptidase [Legionella israelensis]SCY30889.1 D-Ala-D-Ala dipeptidase vanX. Metallo peptidase. MEROPS family M15D [Legionella israelensis DSM 19235]STX58595.1 D-alanyl-D-alanine dipeptidase [Legionella israelensis]